MYEIRNPMDRALEGLEQSASTYANMDKDIPAEQDPGPTTGGTISAGMGGATAGAMIGSYTAAGATAGPWGAVIGAVVGIGAYLLS